MSHARAIYARGAILLGRGTIYVWQPRRKGVLLRTLLIDITPTTEHMVHIYTLGRYDKQKFLALARRAHSGRGGWRGPRHGWRGGGARRGRQRVGLAAREQQATPRVGDEERRGTALVAVGPQGGAAERGEQQQRE